VATPEVGLSVVAAPSRSAQGRFAVIVVIDALGFVLDSIAR
jgi:hypothetical protein